MAPQTGPSTDMALTVRPWATSCSPASARRSQIQPGSRQVRSKKPMTLSSNPPTGSQAPRPGSKAPRKSSGRECACACAAAHLPTFRAKLHRLPQWAGVTKLPAATAGVPQNAATAGHVCFAPVPLSRLHHENKLLIGFKIRWYHEQAFWGYLTLF